MCFTAGNDDLARTLIRRKLETEKRLEFVNERRESLEHKLSNLAARLEENRARLDGMRQKAELFSEDHVPAAPADQWGTPDFSVAEADVEVALLREKQGRSRS